MTKRENPFDELITYFRKNDEFICSLLNDIQAIRNLMSSVAGSFIRDAKSLKKALKSYKCPKNSHNKDIKFLKNNAIRFFNEKYEIKVRLLYNLLTSTIVSYGKNKKHKKHIKELIPNFRRIEIYRNVFVSHWTEYCELPKGDACYYNANHGFATPRYFKQNIDPSNINNILEKYKLDVTWEENDLLSKNIPIKCDEVYQEIEEKYPDLQTYKNHEKTQLGKFMEEISDHILLLPITDLKEFFDEIIKKANRAKENSSDQKGVKSGELRSPHKKHK